MGHAAGTLKRRNTLKQVYKNRYLYLLLLPGLAYFLLFRYFPMGGIVIAFKNYNIFKGVWDSPWVGFKYFEQVFSSSDFKNVLRNTLVISGLKLAFAFPAPLVLALLLNEIRARRFAKTVQTLLYLPHFISWTIIGSILIALLSPTFGPFSELLRYLFPKTQNLLTSQKYFWPIVVISDIWKEAGWGTIIYLASLTQVDPNLYEAAQIDGANRWKQMRHITLPCISGVIALLLILRIGQMMNAGYEQLLVLENPAVRQVGDIFDTFVYRVGLGRGEYSFTAAVDMFKSVVSLILIVSADRVIKIIGEEGLL